MAKKRGQQVTIVEVTIVNPKRKRASYGGIFANSDRIQYRGVSKGDHYKIVRFAVYGKPPGSREIEKIKKQVLSYTSDSRSSFDKENKSPRETLDSKIWEQPLEVARNIRGAITKRKGW